MTLSDGQTIARLKLKLDQKVGDLPVDTTVLIRPRSALGSKYVQLTKGTSTKHCRTATRSRSPRPTCPVQFDDIYKIFDKPTREASRQNLDIFGNAFTGRGEDLNVTIQNSAPALAAPRAGGAQPRRPQHPARPLLPLAGQDGGGRAPVAGVNAQLFTDMATTFEAFSRDPQALEATIAKSPSTLDVGTRSFRIQRPFLRDLGDFSVDLRGATHELRGALPIINPALEIGTPTLRRSVVAQQPHQGRAGRAATTSCARPPPTRRCAASRPPSRRSTRSCATSAPTRRCATTGTTSGPTSASTSPSPTPPAPRSARAARQSAAQRNSLGEHRRHRAGQRRGYHAAAGRAEQRAGPPGRRRDARPALQRGDQQQRHGGLRERPARLSQRQAVRQRPGEGLAGQSAERGRGPAHARQPGPDVRRPLEVPPGETFTRENQTGAKLDPSLTTGIYGG